MAVSLQYSEVMVFWDPSDSFSNEIMAMQNMYETLLHYDPLADDFKPVLATSWDRSEDGLTWTFHLRQGVKFHTGKEMTSADVKGSIERTIQRGQGASFIWDPLDRIETPDDYTVVFHLKYPAPLDLIVSAGYSAYIFDVDVADEEWFNAGNDAGTGPYTVESWTQGEQLVLTRFDDYWGGWNDPRQWDKVVFRIVPEAATRRQLMETGQGDFTYGLPPEMVEALRSNANLQVVETPSFQNLLGMLNTEKAPLDDVRVRKALAHAFPYQQVVDHVMQGTARPARGPIPYGMWGHGEDLPQPGYDLDEARRLLAEAGYPDGGFSLVLTYTAGDEVERRAAELYQVELASLGIDLEIRAMPWEQQWDLARSPDPQQRQDILLFYWWPDLVHPQSWLDALFKSQDEILFNLSYYSNPEYDALVERGVAEAGLDREQAAATFIEAQRLLLEDAAALFIFDQKYVRVTSNRLGGYADNPAYPHVVRWYETYNAAR
nr:ABC transporter substrate-binding protein [Bacillota bacterium]